MSKKIKVRPGKTQSKAGFVIGIIFCLIGLFAVVPIFGPFGLVWTGMAVWITYLNYRNGFTDRPISNQIIEVEDNENDITVTKRAFGEMQMSCEEEKADENEDIEIRLRKLQGLYEQGLITQEEYKNKRQEILDEL